MAADKRADISVAMPGRKILCELKRDYHADVWTAAEHQLDRFYAHDPEAGGFGVYVVFWFGKKRPLPIPAPPGGRARPNTADQMEKMLRELLPVDLRNRIAVIVIDVSGPLATARGKTPTKKKPVGRSNGARKRKNAPRLATKVKKRSSREAPAPKSRRKKSARKKR